MMWWEGDWGWAALITMAVLMVAFWALLIWTFVSLSGGHHEALDSESILAERFARGDIDDDEYRRRRELLRSSR